MCSSDLYGVVLAAPEAGIGLENLKHPSLVVRSDDESESDRSQPDNGTNVGHASALELYKLCPVLPSQTVLGSADVALATGHARDVPMVDISPPVPAKLPVTRVYGERSQGVEFRQS